jgi:hypothetical protein
MQKRFSLFIRQGVYPHAPFTLKNSQTHAKVQPINKGAKDSESVLAIICEPSKKPRLKTQGDTEIFR